jgi:hypothetical protein
VSIRSAGSFAPVRFFRVKRPIARSPQLCDKKWTVVCATNDLREKMREGAECSPPDQRSASEARDDRRTRLEALPGGQDQEPD